MEEMGGDVVRRRQHRGATSRHRRPRIKALLTSAVVAREQRRLRRRQRNQLGGARVCRDWSVAVGERPVRVAGGAVVVAAMLSCCRLPPALWLCWSF